MVEAHVTTTFEGEYLSFAKDCSVKILSFVPQRRSGETTLYKAEQYGRVGEIPSHHVMLKPHPWFFGTTTRLQAEAILKRRPRADGEFLIRESESSRGHFSMSVMYKGTVEHFHIRRQPGGFYELWSWARYSSLNELVAKHRVMSICRSRNLFLLDMAAIDEVRAMYEVVAKQFGELNFQRREVITVIDDGDKVTWRGLCGDRSGVFPAYCVRPVNPVNLKARALRDYDPLQCDKYLTFKRGDIVTVIDEADMVWWRGFCNGQVGLFPSTSVREMGESDVFQVRASLHFEAQGPEDLPFNTGDLITVIDGTDKERWCGRRGSRVGVFPASYVKRIGPDTFEARSWRQLYR